MERGPIAIETKLSTNIGYCPPAEAARVMDVLSNR